MTDTNGSSLTARLRIIVIAIVSIGGLSVTGVVLVLWIKPDDNTLIVSALTGICGTIITGLLTIAVQMTGRAVEQTPAQTVERIERERAAREVGRKEGVQQERERANP